MKEVVLWKYTSVQETALRWGILDRRVRLLCDENKISGVIRKSCSYRIQ